MSVEEAKKLLLNWIADEVHEDADDVAAENRIEALIEAVRAESATPVGTQLTRIIHVFDNDEKDGDSVCAIDYDRHGEDVWLMRIRFEDGREVSPKLSQSSGDVLWQTILGMKEALGVPS